MNKNNPDDGIVQLAIITLAYTRRLPLEDAAIILAHPKKWPRYSIETITQLAAEWDDEMGFYRYHNLAKALRLYKNEIKKQETKNEQI